MLKDLYYDAVANLLTFSSLGYFSYEELSSSEKINPFVPSMMLYIGGLIVKNIIDIRKTKKLEEKVI